MRARIQITGLLLISAILSLLLAGCDPGRIVFKYDESIAVAGTAQGGEQ